METKKNNDEPIDFSKTYYCLNKVEKFYDEIIVPNGLENVFIACLVIAIIVIVISVLAFFIPLWIKLISLWWNLIL